MSDLHEELTGALAPYTILDVRTEDVAPGWEVIDVLLPIIERRIIAARHAFANAGREAVAQARAEAWDEGSDAGAEEAFGTKAIPNPYRQHVEEVASDE